MESFMLIGLLGTITSVSLGVLACFKKWQPYALFVLGASFLVANFFGRQAAGESSRWIEIWLTYSFIMLGVQVVLAPVALVAFIVKRNRSRLHGNC